MKIQISNQKEPLFTKENCIDSMENPAFYNAEIKKSIITALAWYSNIPMEERSITVNNGFVNLGGKVQFTHQKTAMAYLIQKVKGVVGVTNNICVANKFLLTNSYSISQGGEILNSFCNENFFKTN